jgi:hypothetical protein
MFNWFFDILAAKSAKATNARKARLARMVQLKVARNELQAVRNGTTPATAAVLHAAGKLRAVGEKAAA